MVMPESKLISWLHVVKTIKMDKEDILEAAFERLLVEGAIIRNCVVRDG